MEKFIIPKDYHSELNLHDTQIAIKTVKDFFQNLLSQRLNLSRVSAPLSVEQESFCLSLAICLECDILENHVSTVVSSYSCTA